MHYLIFFCFLIELIPYSLYSQTLANKIDNIIEQQLPQATVGILVKNAQTGETIYTRNADKLLSPASSMKLFTAAAALYKFNPNYYIPTTLAQKNQDFYLTFNGAPDFTVKNLTTLLTNLQKAGINTIKGSIILDISRFKPPYYAGGMSYDDFGWYYAAPETAVILNKNAALYDFISAEKIGMPIKIKAKNSETEINIINQVTTATAEQAKKNCTLNIEQKPNNTLHLFGCLAKTTVPKVMQLAIPDPVWLTKKIIQKNLKKNNINLQGKIILGHTPKDANIIATIKSNNLAQLVNYMLKNSDNLYANSISRILACETNKAGSIKQGAFAIKNILAQNTDLNLAQIELTDGMGTRYNLSTPKQLVTLLTNIYNNKTIFPFFLKALPQAGVSGSLQDRMKQTNLNKIVFAKTGTMHDISSLSGYIISPQSHPFVFSIIINGINQPISRIKAFEEQILETIYLANT